MGVTGNFRLLILISAVLFNAGCGFQLRGALDISDSVSPLYLEQGSAFELAREIKSLITKNNVALADSPVKSSSALVLVSEGRNRRVLSVDSNGRAREYLLTYTVKIKIKIQQAKEVNDSVTLSRSLLFDPDEVLAATNESEILYRDMRKGAARLILLKLQARSNSQLSTENNSDTGDAIKEQQAQPAGNNGSLQ